MARRCSPQGRWSAFGPCVEPEPCADGALEVRACGADGLGLQSRVCSEARWRNTSVCVFPVRCTEATEGVCSRPVGEVCNGLDDDADGAVDEGLAGPTAVRPASTFDLAVAQTVARGIERIRWQEAQGHYRVGDAEDNAAWAALAVMAQRDRDGLGAPLGYGRLSAADQAMVRRLMTIALQRMPVSLSGQDYAELVERLSPAVLALSTYVPSGGPALPVDRLEGLTIEQIWRNAVAQLLRQQADARWPQSQGGWGRVTPGLHADFDMTHLAGCALASAAPVMPEVEAAFTAVQPLLTLHQVLDGGYRSLLEQRSGTSATAGGHWLAARSGLAPNQRRRAAALAWLADHHAPDAVIDPIQLRTAYLSKWSIYHSLAGAGGMHDPRFATRVPSTTPWPDAAPGVHFDLAMSLLGWQSPAGHIGGAEMGSPVGHSYQHDHLISLLFLSRHTCEPALPLPDLAGAPHCNDGIDNDGDGLIDAADPECRFTCTLRESPMPACSNGLDDDGDGRIDHQEDPGCSGPEGEVEDPECDNGRDDDGDGQIDWGAIGEGGDAHCDSPADRCEAADTTWCGEACVYLASDEDHCGRCNRPCNPGVACEDGVCMEGPGLLAGVQLNAAEPTLSGWRECHRGPFAVHLPLADLRNDCQGQYIAMGCRNVASPTWALLAMGEAAAVWTDTQPPEGAAPHLHNGATWFFGGSGHGAMGFGAPGTTLRAGGRCGGEVSVPEQFMCWNTTNGNLIEGHRCGERFGGAALNRYERAVWVYP